MVGTVGSSDDRFVPVIPSGRNLPLDVRHGDAEPQHSNFHFPAEDGGQSGAASLVGNMDDIDAGEILEQLQSHVGIGSFASRKEVELARFSSRECDQILDRFYR